MSKLIALIGSAFAVVLLILATLNYARLESHTDAPSVGQLAAYVGLPVLAFVAIVAGVSWYVTAIVKPFNPPEGPSSANAFVPVVKPSPTLSELNIHDPDRTDSIPDDTASKSNSRRLYIWRILDELSDALRDDDEGSEALFVVRERYHRIQFGRNPPEESQASATKSPQKANAA
jgi:hypothetical protein